MFAILVFDKLKNLVYIYRDPFGIKPLFYTRFNSQEKNPIFAFASELGSLIKTNKKKCKKSQKNIAVFFVTFTVTIYTTMKNTLRPKNTKKPF